MAKVLANRLAPHVQDIISPSQSTFIKGHSIQDIHGANNYFHRSKAPMLFLNARPLTVPDGNTCWKSWNGWDLNRGSIYEPVQHTRVMLNGQPGKMIKHRRGPASGDPSRCSSLLS